MRRYLVCSTLAGAFAAGCATGSDDPLPGGAAVNEASVDGAPAGNPGEDGEAAGEDASPDGGEADDRPASDSTLNPGDSASLDEPSSVDVAGPDATADDASTEPDTGPDAADAGATDLAPAGTGYTWQSMTSATADTGKLPAPAVNDSLLSTQVNIDSSSGDTANAWEAAGVVFSSALTVTSVSFVQGTTGSATSGDGWFEANFGLQLSTNGTTWTSPGWTSSPAYAYSSAVSGKTFTFSGPPIGGVRGIRVVGQVNTVGKSWWEAVKEVIVLGP